MDKDFINESLEVIYSKGQFFDKITGKIPVANLKPIFQNSFLNYKFTLLKAPRVEAIHTDNIEIALGLDSHFTYSALLLESKLEVRCFQTRYMI